MAASVGATMVLLSLASGAVWATRARNSDPHHVALPHAEVAAVTATQAYFAHQGKPLLVLRRVTKRQLPARAGDCGAFLGSLDKAGQPRRLANVAAGVPDPALRDAAISHIRAVSGAVARCGSPSWQDLRRRVEFTGVVLDRLLERDGVRT